MARSTEHGRKYSAALVELNSGDLGVLLGDLKCLLSIRKTAEGYEELKTGR